MDQEEPSLRTIRYSLLASKDIEGIYEYTLNTWGVDQADRYSLSLFELIDKVADGELSGRFLATKRKRKMINFTWPGSRYSHRVIFQDLPDSIIVLRIIPTAQKMPSSTHFARLESPPPDQDPTP